MVPKFLMICPLNDETSGLVSSLQTRIKTILGRPLFQPVLPPHLTLHPPFSSIEGKKVISVIQDVLKEAATPLVVRIGSPVLFQSKFLVLPVSPSLNFSMVWTGVHISLADLMVTGEKKEFWGLNTPHVTIADDLDLVSQTQRDRLAGLPFPPVEIELRMISLYTKDGVGPWRLNKDFLFSQ